VPYDPLASDTAVSLKPPSARPLVRHRPARPRRIQSRDRRDPLDFFIAIASVALVFLMAARGRRGRFLRRLDRPHRRTHRRHHHGVPLFVLAMGIVAALGNTVENIILATAIVNFRYTPASHAPKPMCAARPALCWRHGFRQRRCPHRARQVLPNIMPIMVVQMSLTMGYAILNAAGLSFIGLGVRPPTAEWGIMVAKAPPSWSRANGGSPSFQRRADGRGVLLQPPRRRTARHRRPQRRT